MTIVDPPTERRRGERRKASIRKNRLVLGAYGLIVFLTALGFYFFDREAQLRDEAICKKGNELRTGIQRFVNDVARDSDPETDAYIDRLVDQYFQLSDECPPEK